MKKCLQIIYFFSFVCLSGVNAQIYPANPDAIVACFVGGNITAAPQNSMPTVVSDPYLTRINLGPYVMPTHDKIWATAGQTGSVYGLAWSPTQNTAYAAAYVKSHMMLGPGNGGNPAGFGSAGAIYALSNPPSGGGPATVTVLLDIGAAAGTTPRNPSGTDMAADPASIHHVGRVGWGDIDVSPDGNILWAMNLFNKSLYKIALPSGTILGTYPIPGVSGGPSFDSPYSTNENLDFRPFGLKVTSTHVYVGVINSGESSAHPTQNFYPLCDASNPSFPNLRGYVFEFNISTSTYNRHYADLKLLIIRIFWRVCHYPKIM